jgi:hypothetical protein
MDFPAAIPIVLAIALIAYTSYRAEHPEPRKPSQTS